MHTRTPLLRPLLGALLALAVTGALRAQFELKSTNGNRLFLGPVPVMPTDTPPLQPGQPQFAGFGETGASAGPIADTGTLLQRYPSAKFIDPGTGAATGGGIVLSSGRFGNAFAGGVPRYLLGDTITAPETQFDGVTVADASYWRREPVRPGEEFTQPGELAATTGAPVRLISLAVTAQGTGYTSAPTVTFTGGGGGGATATAQITAGKVTALVLTNAGVSYTSTPTITLTGGGGTGATGTVTSEALVPAGATLSYYYSPHADRVFAKQSGRVTITWVSRVPVATSTDAQLRYRYKDESFSVSSATLKPTRPIYWTERSFNSPAVSIPAGSIESVNPIYTTNFPSSVAEEYKQPGISINPVEGTNLPAEKRTLWFDKIGGVGTLHAYNLEGRIFIEYLGALKPGSSTEHVFLGADIVEVARVAPSINVVVNLGDEITPRNSTGQLLPLDSNQELLGYPVPQPGVNATPFYGSAIRSNGRVIYYAERENDNPDRVSFYWLQTFDAAIYFSPVAPLLGISWPLQRNNYSQVWPADPTKFHAHLTAYTNGTTAATTLQFAGGQLPQIIFQDDGKQTELSLDTQTQRLTAALSGDGLNRALLKFSNGTEVWYVRLYTQADDRAGYQEGDGAAVINTTATVGQRINAPNGYTLAGFIAGGTGYNPVAYKDPFAVGVPAAEKGAIIPVNAMPGNNQLEVWWFKKIAPPSASFEPLYVPAKVGRYTVSYPSNPNVIVMASNSGTGDLSPSEIIGTIYTQNDRALPGFNPNEEHAVLLSGRAYALRDDLNDTSTNPATYTSEPYVLISYTSPADQRPAMHPFKVIRELDLAGDANDILFNYPITAGTIIQGPMPLPLMPLPVDANGVVKNTEVPGTPDSAHQGPTIYSNFTFKDRKGYDWVYRGPHAGASPTLGMQFYYTMRAGFFVPGLATQPAVGTVLPYLRPIVAGNFSGDPVGGTSLTIIYRPVWPASAPELHIAESLTLPKFGLPSILNQVSANVLYQQSIANNGDTKPAVVLHDPVREKLAPLGTAGGLSKIPVSIRTTQSAGKTYFQGLPPHLQTRFYFDPNRGAKGALVFLGTFVDEPAGEDYLNLNVLSADDLSKIVSLPVSTDDDATAWTTAVTSLTTKVETFIEDPLKPGTYKVGASSDVGATSLAVIGDPDTAVVDYALTATGQGTGWVTLVFGNGKAFTPQGDPVAVQVIKVAPQLYTGELKVKLSSNPLDEQVSLRHSGDFAARPEDYEFEWRYAPPADGVAPRTYTYALTSRLGTDWRFAQNPAAAVLTETEYAAALAGTTPRTVVVNNASYNAASGAPGLVMQSVAGIDFTAVVPAQIVLSADLNDRTGFVLYVNDVAALAYAAPAGFTNTPASTGLVTGGLTRQFSVASNYFRQGVNKLALALYSTASTGTSGAVNFMLHASTETDEVAAIGSPWQLPNGTLLNQVVVGGSPTAPLGSPLLVMTDNYFTMRYRPKADTNNVAGTGWSRWMPPKLVEGWIKRVLAGINPFNQRVSDMFNNAVNTDVSLITQAGPRWEGNVALSITSINDFGLIEIYETLLNRAKNISIDSGYDYGPANDALLLAAGYLNDLYTILGNEAYADAANPTISVDDSSSATEVNTSRFSFEGQVSSVLDEELALLRGRDDFVTPGVTVNPAYNRLYWNYTRGINSGEALYAVNYNIREKVGSRTANGILDAADAQRMFPQGHGDAYGHYLTALSGYYRLLTSPKFTWTPRAEAVTVLGQAVQVDYFDERKFAAAAGNLANTAAQILALTYRQSYKDDPAAGWTSFRDGKVNSKTGTTRQWGLDEWTSRSTQGAFYHWVVGNALLPDKDNDPNHTGVQVIDRTTVPALNELVTTAASFQTTIDNANAHLNPLGLSPGAIAFDISPTDLKSGKSHYEQIYERSLRAVLNAKGAFDQAAKMTRSLRNQENQVDTSNSTIVDQEKSYVRQLKEIYGTPYTGDIGAGKTYVQGYTGPDLINWFVVDRASDLVDDTAPIEISVNVPVNVDGFTTFDLQDIANAYDPDHADTKVEKRTLTIEPELLGQYADVWSPETSFGIRPVVGAIQQALLDVNQAELALRAATAAQDSRVQEFSRRLELYNERVTLQEKLDEAGDALDAETIRLAKVKYGLTQAGKYTALFAGEIEEAKEEVVTAIPAIAGLAFDIGAPAKGAVVFTAGRIKKVLEYVAEGINSAADYLDITQMETDIASAGETDELLVGYEFQQQAYEFELLYRKLVQAHFEFVNLQINRQRAFQKLRNLIAEGERIQAERETFRQRAAALIQGYRTKDLTFRAFRNEALEQYRSLFDLASRYTYLAAKSYDYETGLLGSTAGQAVVNGIVASRSLGDLTGGTPQATVSTLGDSGLAGTMARIQADWSVAKGRLGINNPDTNGTLFSLRRELFRLLDDPATTDDDAAWQQTLEQHIMSNIMADADVAANCRNLRNADGSPVPGIVIPFSTTIQDNLNFFGLPLASGDHTFSPSNYSTKIYSLGMVFPGYVGMDPYRQGVQNAGTPNSTAANSLSATPYVYLIPTGTDYMLSPPLGDTGEVRGWSVKDQALPLPFNLGATAFSSTQFFNANGTLSEQPWILRKHQAFRPVQDAVFFYSSVPGEFTNSRLVGRSAWNSGWKIVIPAKTLHSNTQDGLNRFVASVKDIELFLRTYSHSGN